MARVGVPLARGAGVLRVLRRAAHPRRRGVGRPVAANQLYLAGVRPGGLRAAAPARPVGAGRP
eukprot:2806805-Lingulodinium_polyedra.AAC.1